MFKDIPTRLTEGFIPKKIKTCNEHLMYLFEHAGDHGIENTLCLRNIVVQRKGSLH